MARMLVIYSPPSDPEAFDRHYTEVHVPLARALPGLRRYDVSRGPVLGATGEPAAHLVASLEFDDLPSLQAALASEEGRAVGRDLRNLVPDGAGVQVYIAETVEA